MTTTSFDDVLAQIQADRSTRRHYVPSAPLKGNDLNLPEILQRHPIGKIRRVAPGITVRPIKLPYEGKARAFLLRSEPGVQMLEHSHTGNELTCVLEGSFSHGGERYAPGDFDLGDETVDHKLIVGDEGPCLCVVAMTGNLRLNGLLGRLISPFVRL